MYKPKLPYIIGVSGGTSSGKSLVTQKIIEQLGSSVNKRLISIHLDSFYKEVSEKEKKMVALGQYDFDHPSAFDFDRLVYVLEELGKGKAVDVPVYDILSNSVNGTVTVEPADVIIVEGILVFYDERVRSMCAMKLFVDADADTRLARRVQKDTKERLRPLPVVLTHYTKKVKPAFEEFCQPTKRYADVIIPRGGENDVAISLIVENLQDIFRKLSPENSGHSTPVSLLLAEREAALLARVENKRMGSRPTRPH